MMHTTSTSGEVLRVQGLNVAYRSGKTRVPVVHDVSFSVAEGQTVGIVGESGSGKSTTLHALARLLPRSAVVNSGPIELNGRVISELSDREFSDIRGREVGMIFQNPMSALNPSMRIAEQIGETLTRHLDVGRELGQQRVRDLLDMVGLASDSAMMSAYPHQLSGGMRQRVMIAIAISCDPPLLLADEPTTALDVTIQAQIMDLLRNLTQSQKKSLIIVTHDLGVIANVADYVLVMYQGAVIEANTTDEIFYNATHPYTRRLLELSSRHRR